jgi:hypothetical protein
MYQSRGRFEQWQKDLFGPGQTDFEAYADDCLMLINVDQLIAQAHLLHGSTATISGRFVASFYQPDSFDSARCSSRMSALVVDDGSVRQVLATAGVGDPGSHRQASDE